MFPNRVTELLGVDIPIVQAPMGWIARVRAGLGRVERRAPWASSRRRRASSTSSADEIRRMRDLTDKPFGVNIAQAFVSDPSIVDFVVDQGIRFVTTSAAARPGTRPS